MQSNLQQNVALCNVVLCNQHWDSIVLDNIYTSYRVFNSTHTDKPFGQLLFFDGACPDDIFFDYKKSNIFIVLLGCCWSAVAMWLGRVKTFNPKHFLHTQALGMLYGMLYAHCAQCQEHLKMSPWQCAHITNKVKNILLGGKICLSNFLNVE